MAKNANAPAANGNEQQAPLGFLAQLSTLATAITDLSSVAVKKDPLINARTKFSANCDESVKLIKAAAESAKFFRKLPDGYLITFRNGNSAMPLNGAAHFKVADATAAIALVEAAKTASAAGELDAAFTESARNPRKGKIEAPAQAAPQA
jgi:hypothetical protein